MGAGTSQQLPIVTYHCDRGGVYTVVETIDKRKYRWFQHNATIIVDVVLEENSVRSHLVEFQKENIHFTNERGSHIDIVVKEGNIEIKDVFLKHKGMCSEATTKTIFCAIRTYVERFGRPVLYGNVNITSQNAKAAFNCYRTAFANNGFETDSTAPTLDNIKHWTVLFIKSIIIPLKLR